MDDETSRLGLDDLLDSDMSSYELYHSLPRNMQRRIAARDVRSFGEMCAYLSGRTDSGLS